MFPTSKDYLQQFSGLNPLQLMASMAVNAGLSHPGTGNNGIIAGINYPANWNLQISTTSCTHGPPALRSVKIHTITQTGITFHTKTDKNAPECGSEDNVPVSFLHLIGKSN